jgi:hypothetical protein
MLTRPLILGMAALAACAIESEPIPQQSTTTQELATAGIERIIPIRFSHLTSCASGATCMPLAPYEKIQESIEIANRIYRKAGIQFYIESNDVINVPTLADNIAKIDPLSNPADPPLVTLTFADVFVELNRLFPNVPVDAWYPGTRKNVREWIHAANTVYEDNRRIHMWIDPTTDCDSSAAFPITGRGIRMCKNHFGGVVLAHELGHFFGLAHVFKEDEGVDPRTLAPATRSDRYDLVYRPGFGDREPQFFNSAADAAPYEDSLQLIDPGCDDESGMLTCQVYGLTTLGGIFVRTFTTGDPELKGLAFVDADGNPGTNLMSYRGSRANLSDSQIQTIREYLRWDVPIRADSLAYVTAGYNEARYGALTNLTGRRPRLGNFAPLSPARELDFDGDHRRDIVFFIPAFKIGEWSHFQIRLSTKGFSSAAGSAMEINFGQIGDLPVLGDYDGDGRTDIAVFQPGGGISRDDPTATRAYWRYCVTASDPLQTSCANPPAPIAFGGRGDTPMAGYNFDGVGGSDLAVYRATTGTAIVRDLSGGFTLSKQIGLVRGGVVPMPGSYDCDAKADLAVYEPSSAKLRVLLSGGQWSDPINHQLDTKLIPQPLPDGTAEARSGAIALGGMHAVRACPTPLGVSVPRVLDSLAVYHPDDGSWNIVWNPTNATAPVTSCTLGGPDRYIPMPGFDANDDGLSDLAVYRSSASTGGFGTFSIKPIDAACNGTSTTRASSLLGAPRVRMFAVSDTTGDGKDDLVVVDQDAKQVRILTSESGYAVSQLFAMPDLRAELL